MIEVAPVVQEALEAGSAVVALESTIITHGLPHPHNLEMALAVEERVRASGAVPATICVLEGKALVGLERSQLQALAGAGAQSKKLSQRDLARAIYAGDSGGTTVSATLLLAKRVGIKFFATGGLGGVHPDVHLHLDISQDLGALAQSGICTISSGVKSILDIPKSLQLLETLGVDVLAYKQQHFPGFLQRSSAQLVPSIDSVPEFSRYLKTHWQLRPEAGILLANPVPASAALEESQLQKIQQQAQQLAQQSGVTGPALTPFLLKKIQELSAGKALEANLALIKGNAQLAAQLAQNFYS